MSNAITTAEQDALYTRQYGVHYTPPEMILQCIRPLFLKALEDRTDVACQRPTPTASLTLLQELSELKILDPACGSGNFLVCIYQHLQHLQAQLLEHCASLDAPRSKRRLRLSQFTGFDIDTKALKTAHERLTEAAENTDNTRPTLKAVNALREDWHAHLRITPTTYITGNPPFLGKKARTQAQREELRLVFGALRRAGTLDYCTAWLFKAAETLGKSGARCAFILTNSITHGEQPGVLWTALTTRFHTRIHFARKSQPWSQSSEKAQVHVVIIGIQNEPVSQSRLIEADGTVHYQQHAVSPHLTLGSPVVVVPRDRPLHDGPAARYGSMPNDGGALLFSPGEYEKVIAETPSLDGAFRPFHSARKMLRGTHRYCLWLADDATFLHHPFVKERVHAVATHRRRSTRSSTRLMAERPHRFGEDRQPSKPYMIIPRHTSQHHLFIPCVPVSPDHIAGDTCVTVLARDPFLMGCLCSETHRLWVHHIAGRIKSDLRYSIQMAYNTFPLPQNSTPVHKQAVEDATTRFFQEWDGVMVRTTDQFNASTQLAHMEMNKAVDRCFGFPANPTDVQRMAHLFSLYSSLIENERGRES